MTARTILIDCRFASGSTGLGRYTRELVSHLLRRDDPWRYVLLVSSEQEEWLSSLPSSNMSLLQTHATHYSLAEQLTLPALIASVRPSFAFFPHFNVPLRLAVPFVATVHDLILHRFPNAAPFWKYVAYRFLMGHTIRNAQSIIAVSQFTGHEIERVYGEKARKKIHVIHQGVTEHFRRVSESDVQAIRKKYDIHRPYILYVGNAKQHKNVQMLIDAHARCRDCFDLLLVTGGLPAGRQGPEVPALRLHAGIQVLSGLPDTDLPALYSGAHCMATASLYEGFCLPALEALSCGCPVVAVDSGPLREFSAPPQSLSIVEPDAEAIARAVIHMHSPVSSFLFRDWQKTADETAAVLKASMF